MRQASGRIEGIFAESGEGGGEGELAERAASREGTGTDGGDGIGEGDRGQGGTIHEGTIPDGGDGGGKGEVGEGGALEGARRNGDQVVRKAEVRVGHESIHPSDAPGCESTDPTWHQAALHSCKQRRAGMEFVLRPVS